MFSLLGQETRQAYSFHEITTEHLLVTNERIRSVEKDIEKLTIV